MITLYGLKACDTCRKALSQLKAAQKPVQFVDIRECETLPTLLPSWIEAIGLDRLVNTRSTTWRNLGEDDRALAKAGDIETLCTHRTLIKRPIVDHNGQVSIGLGSILG